MANLMRQHTLNVELVLLPARGEIKCGVECDVRFVDQKLAVGVAPEKCKCCGNRARTKQPGRVRKRDDVRSIASDVPHRRRTAVVKSNVGLLHVFPGVKSCLDGLEVAAIG